MQSVLQAQTLAPQFLKNTKEHICKTNELFFLTNITDTF